MKNFLMIKFEKNSTTLILRHFYVAISTLKEEWSKLNPFFWLDDKLASAATSYIYLRFSFCGKILPKILHCFDSLCLLFTLVERAFTIPVKHRTIRKYKVQRIQTFEHSNFRMQNIVWVSFQKRRQKKQTEDDVVFHRKRL